jgi:hypothetical protein
MEDPKAGFAAWPAGAQRKRMRLHVTLRAVN